MILVAGLPAAALMIIARSRGGNDRSFVWETLASGVDGNFAYTVAVERYTASADGAPPAQTELRATHAYRREDGHWRAVHRHADRRPPDEPQTEGISSPDES